MTLILGVCEMRIYSVFSNYYLIFSLGNYIVSTKRLFQNKKRIKNYVRYSTSRERLSNNKSTKR